MQKDYYKILNLEPGAGIDEIKQAYRVLAKKYHPDINKSNTAGEKFIEISQAYEYLLGLQLNPKEANSSSDEQLYTWEYIEEMQKRARERAKEKARIRKEKAQKAKQEFRDSGMYDLVLLGTYIVRYLLLFFCIFLIFWTIYISIRMLYLPWLAKIIIFSAASAGVYGIYKNKKAYFFAGKFYYNFSQLKNFFKETHNDSQEYCSYCQKRIANSHPYKLGMVKIKGVQLSNYGPAQHGVSFNQKSVTLSIPRSQFALSIHAILIFIKVFTMVLCLFFFPVDSIVWRVIAGFIAGLVLSGSLLYSSRTNATQSFLLTPNLLIRLLIWMIAIIGVTRFEINPFNIRTSDNIYGVVTAIFLGDTFLAQFLNFISRNHGNIPIFSQPPIIDAFLEKKYQFGYDMPVLTVFYPIFKWFFG